MLVIAVSRSRSFTLGFVLSILYFVTTYLTSDTIFGPLAPYRVELILAGLIVLASLHLAINSFILKTPQSLALIGLAVAVFLSVLIGRRWAGGSLVAFLAFIPLAFGYFLVCLHCNSKVKLQVVVLTLLFVCLFVIAHASFDILHAGPAFTPTSPDQTYLEAQAAIEQWNVEHPYLLEMELDSGERFYRIRGLGVINDPNDFAQLTVCLVPLMFIFWRPKKAFQNTLFVILPICILLVGVFLTHSRGALVALAAIAIVAGRRRIGTVPAVLLGVALFSGAMALQFTAGRDISATAGEDRTALWGEGLTMLKAHPAFGVGYGSFSDYSDEQLTAHNTIIVCAAELGLFGMYFWSMFLFTTARDALAISAPMKVSEEVPVPIDEPPFPRALMKSGPLDNTEIIRWGRLVFLSITGFLVAGMFLSRAFTITLFLLGGMAEVIFEMALERGMVAPRPKLPRVLWYSGCLMISLLLMMYIIVRVLKLMH
jgi:hypothetical protein